MAQHCAQHSEGVLSSVGWLSLPPTSDGVVGTQAGSISQGEVAALRENAQAE